MISNPRTDLETLTAVPNNLRYEVNIALNALESLASNCSLSVLPLFVILAFAFSPAGYIISGRSASAIASICWRDLNRAVILASALRLIRFISTSLRSRGESSLACEVTSLASLTRIDALLGLLFGSFIRFFFCFGFSSPSLCYLGFGFGFHLTCFLSLKLGYCTAGDAGTGCSFSHLTELGGR